jgi:hypothetical protein
VNVEAKRQYQINNYMGGDLDDYVGFRASKEISQRLEQMEFMEIAELKESLETILKFLSDGKIYS